MSLILDPPEPFPGSFFYAGIMGSEQESKQCISRSPQGPPGFPEVLREDFVTDEHLYHAHELAEAVRVDYASSRPLPRPYFAKTQVVWLPVVAF